MGDSVGLQVCYGGRTLLPTKTSLMYIQLQGIVDSLCRAFAHVLCTSSMVVFPRLILVAVISSSVSLALMALCHLALISSLMCDHTPITRSHLSTQSPRLGVPIPI